MIVSTLPTTAKVGILAVLVILASMFPLLQSAALGSFKTWTRPASPDCNEFHGCLNISQREVYLDPTSNFLPCGFLAPSDLDKVRAYFDKDEFKKKSRGEKRKCRTVVYSLVFQAYNIVFNPIFYENYLQFDPSVCFFLFVDKETVLNGRSLSHVSIGASNENIPKHNMKSAIQGGNAWQIILLDLLPHKLASHAMKAVKLSGPQLFPHADILLWYDPKYVLKRRLVRFIAETFATMKPNASIAISENFFHDIESGFAGARQRLIYQNATFKKNPVIATELSDIERQKNFYKREGLFERTRGNKQLVVDSAVMLYQNNPVSQRYFCAWANEVAMFSRRDQLSEYAIRERLGIEIYKIPQARVLRYFKKIGHQRPSSYVPKFNEVTYPPKNICFHPSGAIPSRHAESSCGRKAQFKNEIRRGRSAGIPADDDVPLQAFRRKYSKPISKPPSQ